MYPIQFESIYFKKIWGGNNLSKLRNKMLGDKIGESWDIACHKKAKSIVKNGIFKGSTLEELIKQYGPKLLGTKCLGYFPLLYKIIDTSQNLSIQVHPSDEFALKKEKELGKVESWYILNAQENSYIILGTIECNKEEFKKAINLKTIEKYLNKIYVKKNDFFYIPSGMVHGLSGGITLIEIQENSDITYRIFDYNRKRELHIDKALEVINFNLKPNLKEIIYDVKGKDFSRYNLCSNKCFIIDKYNIYTYIKECSNEETFCILTCIDGIGKIINNNISVAIKTGESVLIPATLGKYEIHGKCSLLKSYIPY